MDSEFYFALLFTILGIVSIVITELLASKQKS